MNDQNHYPADRSKQRQMALSRWDNEGGATPRAPQRGLISIEKNLDVPELSNAELVQLTVRVIALENIIIALLAEASDPKLELIREMATYISPRSGFTHHPLTIDAAAQMLNLVERAKRYG